jgi:carboxyl-terminal processing protease
MKKLHAVIFLILGFVLLALNIILFSPKKVDINEMPEMLNREQVSPQRLVERTWSEIRDNYYESSMNGQMWYRWKEHYRRQIKTPEDAKVAIDSMLASLNDPYSKFMSRSEYSEQNNSIKSKITGIGVNIASVAGKIEIISVMEGTPAQSANLLPKDIILTIDSKEVSGLALSDVAAIVRGPENSLVELTILRNKDKFTKKIARKEIRIKTVRSTVDKDIGYIQIKSFIGSTTPNEFLEALEKTKATQGLIIDLRGNTGGLLPNAIFIANLFIPEGNLVSIVGRNGFRYDIEAQDTEFGVDKPVVVLVDGASASASEILSGALKDYKKATLLGTQTYGKGMIQKVIPLPNETGLNLTIAKYLTPNGHDINKKGITPDVQVDLRLSDIKNHTDAQYNAAKNLLAEMCVRK